MASDPIVHLALPPEDNAKLTPLEILADFADATQGWIYLERASRHYAEQKDGPALVLRHYRDDVPAYVDLAFATVPGEGEDVQFVILDAPDAEQPLSRKQRSRLVEVFLEALRTYLNTRPDHVRLHVEREQPDAFL